MTYTAAKGWFDITKKPQGMSKAEHKKIQDLQMMVRCEAEKFKDKEVRKNNRQAFEKLQELAAKLQQITLSHWKLEEL